MEYFAFIILENHTLFDSSKSTTYHVTDEKGICNYRNMGVMHCIQGTDTVCVSVLCYVLCVLWISLYRDHVMLRLEVCGYKGSTTVHRKILVGEKIGEFSKSQAIRQNLPCQYLQIHGKRIWHMH